MSFSALKHNHTREVESTKAPLGHLYGLLLWEVTEPTLAVWM